MPLRHLAVYVPTIDPKPAGLGVYVDQLCRRMAARLPRTTLFTETPGTVPSSWPSTVDVVAIPSGKFRRGSARLARRHFWLHAELPATLERCDVDAFFVPFHDGTLRPSRPQFVVIHDLTPLVVPSTYFHPLLRSHLKHVLPLIIRRSEATIAVSRHTKDDLRRILGIPDDAVTVVGEGFDDASFGHVPEQTVVVTRERYGLDGDYLLYAGTYARHKNPLLLADIMADLRRRGRDVRLVLCGRQDSGDFEGVRRALEQRDVWSKTVVLGYVAPGDLAALMAGATAFVYPSLYEGFGIAPLEAMASRAVVLASNAASIPEVVGDGGILLPPTDVAAWVAAVERVLDQPCEARRLREAAVTRSARFSWEASADEILGLIEQKIHHRRTGRRDA